MPPIVPRKRLRDPSPQAEKTEKSPKQKKVKTAKVQAEKAPRKTVKAPKGQTAKAAVAAAPPRKPTLFDDLDADATPRSSAPRGLKAIEIADSDDDDDSSLTSLSDADFDDVPLTKWLRPGPHPDEDGEEDDADEDIEFEDVEFDNIQTPQTAMPDAPISGDLELTLSRDTRIDLSLANALGKKGPSKLERKIRIATHCVHVQLLLWHNATRNAWCCDPEVQGMLLSHIPPRLWDEVDRWRRNSGLEEQLEETPKKKGRGKPAPKGKIKGKAAARESRDWSEAAERLEKGAIDLSHGDPLYRLMKALSAWWKLRFRVTAPGLRKWGYMSLPRLDRLMKAFDQEDHDPERFGERIRSLEEFRRCAQECTGSRDVGSQLFTALLRALGLDARLVASLQPLGFGWNKLEEADPEKDESKSNASPVKESDGTTNGRATVSTKSAVKTTAASSTRSSKRVSAGKETHEEPSDSDSDLQVDDSDNDPAIDIPQPGPRKGKVYDRDLEFPHYWTEVLSPATHKYLPVDPLVKSVVAINRELIESLEPRGGKADKAKQVIAYVVGFSQDGTAKDVTVRYLKRQMLPGRTKGMRLPVEKVPVYNHHGKVKRYDLCDWFKTTMKGYNRGGKDHPITEIDEDEDSTDLKPAKAEKKEVKEGDETLQYYKQSKEFVLERHLKREEALLPRAKPVKVFKNKGRGADGQGEPVYARKDVVQVKSAETWHKQGRAPIPGQRPLKRVPYRAATTNRRRELAEVEAATGAKALQGLYSFDQTDWIIPPPIENGIIPKNEYGNIDLFAEHMCPEGAVHVPYRGAIRMCKRLEIDYAEAVVGFEFGHRMAVPVIQGVVIAEEYHDKVMEELAKDEADKSRKEDEKRRKAALAMWRKFLMGLRIVERIEADYGHMRDDVEVFRRKGSVNDHKMPDAGMGVEDEEMGGGFLPEGYEEPEERATHLTSGFFPVADDEEGEGVDDTLEVDHGEGSSKPPMELPAKAKSVMSTRPKRKAAAKARPTAASSRRRRRRNLPSSSEEEDEDEDDDDEDLE
ncbi:Rad4 transglutaminase-like domain-containing protein [Podospora appendiculata]|uniref:Rad4 transglutaminase-like domain-containing protein n=1 Tax=Podospora appendiculata TaxID=314037 RepID=A0AAE0X838_9PEZI|nr:Rad4 transglutaminase-like domain-containing protein [Podospora appendiculata]